MGNNCLAASDIANNKVVCTHCNKETPFPNNTPKDIEAFSPDHNRLVYTAIAELGIIDTANKVLGEHDLHKASMGERLAVMMTSLISYDSKALYKSPEFVKKRGLESLCGNHEYYNDDSMGRLLDAFYNLNSEKVFNTIALTALANAGERGNAQYLDLTSLGFHGAYKNSEKKENFLDLDKPESVEKNKKSPIRVCKGYPKDFRVDLNQAMLALATTPSGYPFLARALDGNSSDKVELSKIINEYYEEHNNYLGGNPLRVADSALYSKEWIASSAAKDVPWLTRMPETIGEAKLLVKTPEEELSWINLDNGYKVSCGRTFYGEMEQNTYMYRSEEAYNKEIKTLQNRIEKQNGNLIKDLKKLSKKPFGCKEDAIKFVDNLFKKYKFFECLGYSFKEKKLYNRIGRPKPGEAPKKIEYT